MPRYQRRVDADSGYSDGHVFVPVFPSSVTGTAGFVAANTYNSTTNVVGVSLPTSATAYVANIPLNAFLMQRYGVQDDLQEYFGSGNPTGAQGLAVGQPTTLSTASSTAGSNVSVAVLSSVGFVSGLWCTVDVGGSVEVALINSIPDATHIQFATLKNNHTSPFTIRANVFTTPAGVSGAPPYTGITELSAVTAPRPKGILFKQITPVYGILAAAATTNTVALISTTFLNATATTQTTLVASGANGLATAANGGANQFYVTPIPIPTANQVFQTARYTEFSLIWSVTTGTGGTAYLIGVYVDVVYNFN